MPSDPLENGPRALRLVDWCRAYGVAPSTARKARDKGLLPTMVDAMGVERVYVTDGDKFLNAGGKRHVRGRAAQLQAQAAAKEAS